MDKSDDYLVSGILSETLSENAFHPLCNDRRDGLNCFASRTISWRFSVAGRRVAGLAGILFTGPRRRQGYVISTRPRTTPASGKARDFCVLLTVHAVDTYLRGLDLTSQVFGVQYNYYLYSYIDFILTPSRTVCRTVCKLPFVFYTAVG